METMNYPIVIHKDPDSDYGVCVPDLPGCFSAGSSIDEAIAMAMEAIELHMEGLIEAGQPVPRPQSIECHRRNPDYRGGIWALICVDPANLRLNAKRINITMPKRVLDAVDRAAADESDTRSGLLTKAAVAYMAAQQRKPLKPPARTRIPHRGRRSA
jgi:predicted RNase H-like HicB family nuclease